MERTPSYAVLSSPPNSGPQSFRPDHTLTRLERRKLEKASEALNIYDLGAAANLASIFGTRRLGWFIPWGQPFVVPPSLSSCTDAGMNRRPGDGTTFPINQAKLTKLRQITTEIRMGTRVGDRDEEYGRDDGGRRW